MDSPQLASYIAMAGIVGNLLLAVANFLTSRHAVSKVQEVHLAINSRLDAMLKERGESERAKGVIEGVASVTPSVVPLPEVEPTTGATWVEMQPPRPDPEPPSGG